MASKGEVGIELDVARVPLREEGMEAFEIMVSESQERMLCVVEPAQLEAVLAVCRKWEVRATDIGEVTDSRRLRVLNDGDVVGDLPVEVLVDDCPTYALEPERPAAPVYPRPPRRLAEGASPEETLLALLASPTVASKRWAYEQYDTIVGSRTTRRAGASDAAVLQLEADGGHGAIATAIDGNGRRVACDPYTGTVEAVLECARNLACVGAEPLGLTNCLNFGNPEKPHIAWQLTESVRGLGDACRALDVPVVGGNVSLYNEGLEGPIYPTPVVGMVGWLPDPQRVPASGFAREGDAIALIGPFAPSSSGSELEKLSGAMADALPELDLERQARALAVIREAVRSGLVSSAHDVSEGGLAVALAECCIAGRVGARVELPDLFGEGPGGVVVSGPLASIDKLAETASEHGFIRLGEVGGDRLVASVPAATLSVPVVDLATAFETGIPAKFS
jgi:phosphoribosylformylglycinamidine synthase